MRVFILLLFFVIHSNAKELLIRSSEVNEDILQMQLKTDSNYESMVDVYQMFIEKKGKALEIEYLKAHKEFLQGEPEKSALLFKKIVSDSFNQDWNESSRKLINFSYFKLAQLEEINFSRWMESAFNFDREIPPDEINFPPPFQKKWKELDKTINTVEYFPNFPIHVINKIYINGKDYEYDEFQTFKLNKNQNRVTTVSNLGIVKTQIGSDSSIKNSNWGFEAIAQGNCSHHSLKTQLLLGRKFKVLFLNNCILSGDEKTSLTSYTPQMNIPPQLNSDFKSSGNMEQAKNLDFSSSTPMKETTKIPKSTWNRYKWLWLGATVGGALIYNYYQKSKEEQNISVRVSPSHRTGF